MPPRSMFPMIKQVDYSFHSCTLYESLSLSFSTAVRLPTPPRSVSGVSTFLFVSPPASTFPFATNLFPACTGRYRPYRYPFGTSLQRRARCVWRTIGQPTKNPVHG